MSAQSLRVLATLLILGSVAASLPQDKDAKVPYLTPEEAVRKMSLPEGFDVRVYAGEPEIGQPIAFCFDERGRVWVAENYNYRTRGSHKDGIGSRIVILEDTDGDGKFDVKKLFTDQLTFISALAVGMGGVYVGTPPTMAFIPDADGDDRPDGAPKVLLDGWGINDRHETLNSFIWGPDGWLYGCHGVFTQSNVGKPGAPDSERQPINAGIFRYHPIKDRFEIFASGLSNPWGMDFNDQGQAAATACVIPHLFHVIQGGYYHRQGGRHFNPFVYDDLKTIRDHNHKSAHGGARFYLADAFPEPYRNRLFMCNIHQHMVLTDVLERKGSGFVGRHGDDFLSANDNQWVGFGVEIGPEGGVYILDWHDQDICGKIVQHAETGRVYRILPKNAKPIERPNLRALSDVALAELQSHRNDWYVRQARTLLQQRAAAGKLDPLVHGKLASLMKTGSDSGRRLRGLWALHVTKGIDEAGLRALLDHEDEYLRAWAIQLLCEDRAATPAAIEKFAALAAADASPVVRLYLASALQRIDPASRWGIVEALLSRGEDVADHNLPLMIWYGLEPLAGIAGPRAIKLALAGKFPLLREYTARRMVDTGSVTSTNTRDWTGLLRKVAPEFSVEKSGEGGVVHHAVFRNRVAVQTHPVSRTEPCVLRAKLAIPEGKKSALRIRVSHHPHGDWQLVVRVEGQVLLDQIVSPKTAPEEWAEWTVDLTAFAGKRVTVELENRANDWQNEWAYWNDVRLISE